MIYLAILGAFILLFGIVSDRLERTIVTSPMIFTLFGVALGPFLHGRLDVETEVITTVAELTLVLVLFVDASRIDLRLLRKDHNLPLRMLSVGMPLTIILGAIAGRVVFGDTLGWFSVAVLASILAPTDAALGQAVVTNRSIPVRIRQALNVESGINDGVALPAVLIFVSLAGGEASGNAAYWIRFILLQLFVGATVGIVIGGLGGRLVSIATKKQWMNHSFQQLSSLALSVAAFALGEILFGNGFIAAFAAGLAIGNLNRPICTCLFDFGEAEGQLLVLLTFTLFGAVFVVPALQAVTPLVILYAALSLTILRMVPVSLSLLGTGLMADTHLFLGWFGPRGIAGILFGLLILSEASFPGQTLVFNTIVITVLISIFLHGLSAVPAARAYGRKAEEMKDETDMPEMKPVGEMPTK